MPQSFLRQNKPLIVSMILEPEPDAVRFRIKNSIYDGADAIGVQLERIKREYRTEENYRRIFASTGGRPIYLTSYRYCESQGLTDEECVENLLLGLRCGGTLADIPGDMYDRGAESELTYNPEAIERQMKLVDEIHAMGKEVLLSSHICKFTPAEKVVEIALEQQKRGADVAKIVTAANSIEEEHENLRITSLLKKELSIPFLFLSNGTHSKIHRLVGPMLGCIGYLAVTEHDSRAVPTQPTVRAVKAILDNADYLPEL